MSTRRRFLLAGVGIVAVGALGVLGFGRSFLEEQIVSEVRRRLASLKLDEQGLQAFARDQVNSTLAKRPTWNRWKYHFLANFSHTYTRFEVHNDHRTRRERVADDMSQIYLLSSDFFRNGADMSRTVKYIALFDPMVPCGNPFARPPLDV